MCSDRMGLKFDRLTQDNAALWCFTLSFTAHLLVFIALLVLLVVVIPVILKYLMEWGERVEEQVVTRERSPLLPSRKAIGFNYGTCHNEGDIESGSNDITSSSSSSSTSSSSSEDLYDGKICVICYDEQRNCFFVPCGHSVTCNACADRIFYDEGRACPVCRRFIGKIKRLY